MLNNEDELNNVYEDYNNNNDFIKSDVDITAANDEDDNATSLERSVSEQTREAETQTDPISDEQLVVFSEDDGTAEYARVGYATTMTVFGGGRVSGYRAKNAATEEYVEGDEDDVVDAEKPLKSSREAPPRTTKYPLRRQAALNARTRKTRTTNDALDGHLVKSDASRICHSEAKRRRHEHAEQQKAAAKANARAL